MSKRMSDHDSELIKRAGELLRNEYEENSEFNTALDGAKPLEFQGLTLGGDSYRIERSEALFWNDPPAYQEELTQWKNGQIQAKHADTLRLLKEKGQVGLFSELALAIQRQRVAPFVGAGLSCASGFPLWGGALEELLAKTEGVDQKVVRRTIRKGDYLQAAELLWQADEHQVINFIRTKFARREIRHNPQGAVRHLKRLSSGCIVTTNYDYVIEHALDNEFDGYMHGRQEGHNFVPKLLRGERCLLKLHGDSESYKSYVFTRSQYDEAYGNPFDFSLPLPKALRQIFIGHSLLFLGCSLVQDRTLELFEHVRKEFEIPDHFAILPEPKPGKSTEKLKNREETRLLKINVQPIWYPADEHQFVALLLELAIDVANGVVTL